MSYLTPLNSSSATTSGDSMANTISMGGVTLPLSDAIILHAHTTADANYFTVYRNGYAYQVPAGNKLIIMATRALGPSAAAGISLGYGDTVTSTAAPTNAVTESVNNDSVKTQILLLPGDQINSENPTYFEVPAGKYPFVRSSNSQATYIQILAYLEAV